VKGVFEQLTMGLSPRFDGIGQHDGDSGGHHGMINAAEDFRVHPCGIRAEDLVQALLVHFSNRFVSSPVWARSSGAEITPFLAGDRDEIGANFNLKYSLYLMIQWYGILYLGSYAFDATHSPK
jgi:hypothetical protein